MEGVLAFCLYLKVIIQWHLDCHIFRRSFLVNPIPAQLRLSRAVCGVSAGPGLALLLWDC